MTLDHPPTSAAVVRAAFNAALASGTSDPLDPGALAAVPRLVTGCLKPPALFDAVHYTEDDSRRCLVLAAAANAVYRDTGSEPWFAAASAAVAFLYNMRPRRGDDVENATTVLGNIKGGQAADLLGAARPATPIPVRKNLIDIAHASTSWAAVRAAVAAAGKGVPLATYAYSSGSFTPAGMAQDLKACATPINGNSSIDAILSVPSACMRVATYAYLQYLSTGAAGWYSAARAAAAYTWTHDYHLSDALLPEMRFRLTDMVFYLVSDVAPQFIGQAP